MDIASKALIEPLPDGIPDTFPARAAHFNVEPIFPSRKTTAPTMTGRVLGSLRQMGRIATKRTNMSPVSWTTIVRYLSDIVLEFPCLVEVPYLDSFSFAARLLRR
jgi:hypothetical protein